MAEPDIQINTSDDEFEDEYVPPKRLPRKNGHTAEPSYDVRRVKDTAINLRITKNRIKVCVPTSKEKRVYYKRVLNSGIPPLKSNLASAGHMLFSAQTIAICPGETATIPVGLSQAFAKPYMGFIAPKPGLGVDHHMCTCTQIVDPSSTNKIAVSITNIHKYKHLFIHPGTAVAQIVVLRYVEASFKEQQNPAPLPTQESDRMKTEE